MTQWPTPEGIWLIKNQLQVLSGGVCSVSVSGIQHMEETNSSHQRQPGALLARGRLQPLEFSPGEEAAPQQPCLCRSLGLTGSSSSLPKASRECLLVPGNALPQQLGMSRTQAAGRNRNTSPCREATLTFLASWKPWEIPLVSTDGIKTSERKPNSGQAQLHWTTNLEEL